MNVSVKRSGRKSEDDPAGQNLIRLSTMALRRSSEIMSQHRQQEFKSENTAQDFLMKPFKFY